MPRLLAVRMEGLQGCALFSVMVYLLLSMPNVEGQSGDARALDALLQDYAYRAFVRPRTGVVFDGLPPANLSGVQVAAMRLRSGSLRRKGVPRYKEFEIPIGVVVQPYVERLVLVYHNLGNWSSSYYNLSGYSYLTPVLGLLAYNAANLSAKNLPELDIDASMSNISIRFSDVRAVTGGGLDPKCVWFDLYGSHQIYNPVSSNVCSTATQGHFAIVVESTALAEAPTQGPGVLRPSRRRSRTWRVVVGVIGGVLGLALLALLVAWAVNKRRQRKIAKMEQEAEAGEALGMAMVGDTRAPVAMGTRTPPNLENEYAP